MRILTAEHDAVLARVEWPRYIRVGLPLAISVVAAGTLVSLGMQPWEVDGEEIPVPLDAPAIGLVVVLFGVGLAGAFWPRAGDHQLGLALAELAPVALINIGGDALGLLPASGEVGLYQTTLTAVAVVGGSAALRAPRRGLLLVEALCVAVIVGTMAVYPYPQAGLVIWLLALVSAVTTGLMGRAVFVSLRELGEARDELARRAVAEERRRVARDVHDVVAHTLSVTMLHLTAARLAVERAPERAGDALAEAERQGRASLADLRRVVRLLRGEDDGAEPALPTLDELPDLAASYRRAGLDVRLDVDSDVAVSPAVATTIYRVAQESLANAAKHGTGAAELRLAVDGAGARLVVRNPCPAGGAGEGAGTGERGSGLAGMEERVVGLGGTFHAGARGPGGGPSAAAATWVVEADLPADVGVDAPSVAGWAADPTADSAGGGLDRLAEAGT
jgi:signal transduction histidine kinase